MISSTRTVWCLGRNQSKGIHIVALASLAQACFSLSTFAYWQSVLCTSKAKLRRVLLKVIAFKAKYQTDELCFCHKQHVVSKYTRSLVCVLFGSQENVHEPKNARGKLIQTSGLVAIKKLLLCPPVKKCNSEIRTSQGQGVCFQVLQFKKLTVGRMAVVTSFKLCQLS